MPTPILATNNALVVPDDFHGSSSSADLPNSLWATPTAEVYETHVNVSPELSMFPTLKHPQNLEFFVQKNTQDLNRLLKYLSLIVDCQTENVFPT